MPQVGEDVEEGEDASIEGLEAVEGGEEGGGVEGKPVVGGVRGQVLAVGLSQAVLPTWDRSWAGRSGWVARRARSQPAAVERRSRRRCPGTGGARPATEAATTVMKATETAASPVRGPPAIRGPSAARGPVKGGGPGTAAKRTGAGVSPGPRGSPGPGRTPQTKRRELSLTVAATEKNSPTGSPRSRGEEGRGGPGRRADTPRRRKGEEKEPEGSRKSSNSSQDSGVGRDVREAGREGVPRRPQARRPPAIRTVSPQGQAEREVGERQKFGELSDPSVTDIEMGIVKVPRELLEDLIHKEAIEKYYTVDEVPVARCDRPYVHCSSVMSTTVAVK